MIRLGMHSSLWTSAWTREGAELSVADAARHALDIVEIALLEPDKVDVAHSRELFKRHNIAPTASLGLPIPSAFWFDLKEQGLIDKDSPLPVGS